MSYLGELRQNIRPLVAASLGSGTSLPLVAYTTTVFAPHLVDEFKWSRSQFALVGLTMLTTLVLLPFIGRFTDRLGVKRMAIAGTALTPLVYIGYYLMQGSFAYFLFLSSAMLAIGSMTSPLVYTRLIAAGFENSRGLALTIVNCTPAALGAIAAPSLNWSIETIGWRASYLLLGAIVLGCSIVAILLIPRDVGEANARSETPLNRPPARQDFGLILRSRVFWIIFAGMFLCLLGTPLHSSQMNIMLVDNGLTPQIAAEIVSVYAISTIFGRLACGLALDRFATPLVTTVSMILPALGFFLLASSLDTVLVITFAMFLVGTFVGAENDLMSYLVARYFKLRIYSSTFSLVFICSFLASAIGAGAISLTLKLTDSFSPYMFIVSGTVLVGSLLFLLMPWPRDSEKIG